jgi:hypothetical protein
LQHQVHADAILHHQVNADAILQHQVHADAICLIRSPECSSHIAF